MHTLTYLYFVEDQAHRMFLERLLEMLPKHLGLDILLSKPQNHDEFISCGKNTITLSLEIHT